MNVTLKTGVNTRLPLSLRVPHTLNSQPERQTRFSSIHQTTKSTYDVDYTTDPVNFSPEKNTGIDRHTSSILNPQPKSADEIVSEAKEDIVAPQLPYKVVSEPSSRWESEAHAATRSVEPGRPTDFYSTARKVECKNDDARGYGPTVTHRAEEIRMVRSQDPILMPPHPEYARVKCTEACNDLPQKQQIKNYLDLVECSHLNPKTEQQIGFGAPPVSRLPELDFPQSFQPQSKIITQMGTSYKLFQGTAKCLEHKIVGYAGHVPKANANLGVMHNGRDPRAAFAKAYLTLAVSGGGVDASVNGRNTCVFQRRGRYAREPVALKPKNDETICRMVEGSMLQQPIYRTLESERAMNVREDKKRKSYF